MQLTTSLLCAFCVFGFHSPDAAKLPAERGEALLRIGGRDLKIFTYRSKDYAAKQGPLILVFHGSSRNAQDYRDDAAQLAESCGGLAAAPCFDQRQFPDDVYPHGNVLSKGRLLPSEKWTFSLVPLLIDKIRETEKRRDMPYYLIGHSAGGQFVERLLVFTEVKPIRAVAANPGSHLFPTRDMAFPYGFGGLPDRLADEKVLKAYLAKPLTIYVGTADTDPNPKYLDASRTAEREGPTRLARGRKCFEMGRRLARANGWPFHWRLVEALGVSHSSSKMFARPECRMALFGP